MTYLNNGTIDETFYFHMKHGDLLIMTDQTQSGTKHEIVPVPNKVNSNNLPRISATFRTLLPPLPWIIQNTPVISNKQDTISLLGDLPDSTKKSGQV